MRSGRKNNSKYIVSILATILLLVFLYFTNLLGPIKSTIYNTLNPVTSRLYALGNNIGKTYRAQTDKQDFVEIVADLERQVNILTVKNSEYKELEEENRQLKEYFDFFDKQQYKYLLSNVVSKGFSATPEEIESDILIDRGLHDGVIPGLAVVNSEGVLIGKVSKVEENVSRVVLSTNSACKLAATIQNSDRTIGVASGKLGLTINMDFIAQSENILEGDLVITSGLEENIPRGLVIGEVVRINSDNNEIWKSVVLESLANFDDSTIVAVLLP